MEEEWMTLTEIRASVASRGVEGIPYDRRSFREFTQTHGIDTDSRYVRLRKSKNGKMLIFYHVSILTDFAQPRGDDWFNFTEIAAANLPGLGRHRSVIREKSIILGWLKNTEKVRLRRGRGGGNEFHISLLNEEQRAVWLEYCQRRRDGGQADPKPVETPQLPIPTAPDLSAVKNSQLLAELVARVIKAMGDGDSFFKALGDGNG